MQPDRRSLDMYRAPPPRSARVSFTDRCDLACVYCRPSRNDGYLEERLDDASWRFMMQGLHTAGVRRIRITGGEPLLHPRVVERVAYIATLGFEDIALTTNAHPARASREPSSRGGPRKAHHLPRYTRSRAIRTNHPGRRSPSRSSPGFTPRAAPVSTSSRSTASFCAARMTMSSPRSPSGRGHWASRRASSSSCPSPRAPTSSTRTW